MTPRLIMTVNVAFMLNTIISNWSKLSPIKFTDAPPRNSFISNECWTEIHCTKTRQGPFKSCSSTYMYWILTHVVFLTSSNLFIHYEVQISVFKFVEICLIFSPMKDKQIFARNELVGCYEQDNKQYIKVLVLWGTKTFCFFLLTFFIRLQIKMRLSFHANHTCIVQC